MRLALRIKHLMKSFLEGNKSDCDYSPIMEPDFEHGRPNSFSKLEGSDANMNTYGSASFSPNPAAPGDLQLDLCMGEQLKVEDAIRAACERELNCRVVFPPELLARVAGDILRMSVAEPCGVRGCAIILCLQEKDRCHKLATVFGGSFTPPTFEIHVTLREDTRSWKAFQKVFLTIKNCLLNSSQWKSSPRILHPAYQLEKRRLYRGVSSGVEGNGYH
ncbi:hypothetical protein EGW08_006598 [Elysia chlorotica]|uniref:DNA damage-inducible transcript 4-like protein n=1 Tax=Elysia chlorotica TaxID=188477 RepID=A0A3S1A8X1_ELYCH|nr:hypothetical protein EGW08_006598 [Elysia chlorotica]